MTNLRVLNVRPSIDRSLWAGRRDLATAEVNMSAAPVVDKPAALPEASIPEEPDMAGPSDSVAHIPEAVAYIPALVAHRPAPVVHIPVVHIPGLVGNTPDLAPHIPGAEPHNMAEAPHTRGMGRDRDRDSNTGGDDDRPGCQNRCPRLPRLGPKTMHKPQWPKKCK